MSVRKTEVKMEDGVRKKLMEKVVGDWIMSMAGFGIGGDRRSGSAAGL
jgi:hypothetical protein